MSVALQSIEWKGEATFRVLSYYFSIRWNWESDFEKVSKMLEHFAVPPDPSEIRIPPTPGMPPSYSLVDRGHAVPLRFAMLHGETEMMSSPNTGKVIEHLLWHINSEAARQTGDYLLVHAGSVTHPNGGGIILPAPSGAGKTTLVAGLVKAGFGFLSEELGAIDPVTRNLCPYPKAFTFKQGSVHVLDRLVEGGSSQTGMNGQRHVSVDDIRAGSRSEPTDVRLIVAPRFEKDAVATITPMTPAESAVELSRNAVNMHLYRSRGVRLLGEVASKAPGFRLVWGDLDEAVATLTAALP